MIKLLRTLVVSTLLLAPASVAQAQVSLGIQIGEPPAPREYRVPRQPGAGYEWIEGYWYLQGSRYRWHDGFWARPPYQGAYWVDPYYFSGQYFAGRWQGQRGNNRSRAGEGRPTPRPNGRGNGPR